MHIRNLVVGALALLVTAPAARAVGLDLEVGSGVADYSRDFNPQTEAGATWLAQLGLDVTQVLGVDLAYVGSRVEYTGSTFGGVPGAVNENGGTATLHLNLATGLIRPFLFGGVGASRIDFPDNGPFRDATVGTIPTGLGLSVNFGPVIVAARGAYTFFFDNNLTPTTSHTTTVGPVSVTTRLNTFDRWSGMLVLGAHL